MTFLIVFLKAFGRVSGTILELKINCRTEPRQILVGFLAAIGIFCSGFLGGSRLCGHWVLLEAKVVPGRRKHWHENDKKKEALFFIGFGGRKKGHRPKDCSRFGIILASMFGPKSL